MQAGIAQRLLLRRMCEQLRVERLAEIQPCNRASPGFGRRGRSRRTMAATERRREVTTAAARDATPIAAKPPDRKNEIVSIMLRRTIRWRRVLNDKELSAELPQRQICQTAQLSLLLTLCHCLVIRDVEWERSLAGDLFRLGQRLVQWPIAKCSRIAVSPLKE